MKSSIKTVIFASLITCGVAFAAPAHPSSMRHKHSDHVGVVQKDIKNIKHIKHHRHYHHKCYNFQSQHKCHGKTNFHKNHS